MKKITTITYQSKDGKIFDNEESCIAQDERLEKGGIFLYGSEITEGELGKYLTYGNWHLCNYSPGYLSIHASNGGGGWGEIYGEIADRLGKIHDSHNFRVHEIRGN